MTPPADPSPEPELNFAPGGSGDGLASWHRQRAEAIAALGRQLGLPLGRRVRVELVDGVVLTGELHLPEALLFVPEKRDLNLCLAIGRVPFTVREIQSCVVA